MLSPLEGAAVVLTREGGAAIAAPAGRAANPCHVNGRRVTFCRSMEEQSPRLQIPVDPRRHFEAPS